ncbi:putative Ig domain-containing protein [Nocardioides sp. TRM66260-LWL]|uniref:putative Ig domain-containing protein n=1 Tax=Nocardioides sp. TRM66260-LWL TaxID=2874478 RepID=UPI001CC5D2A5|nr:putative Ig domain-containing protein [Nocardioides sp. TRM66260-LWL]MBZ5736040.1 putative Ig domain-containing protein [Nocardioides sp. TRM66260-LWL]
MRRSLLLLCALTALVTPAAGVVPLSSASADAHSAGLRVGVPADPAVRAAAAAASCPGAAEAVRPRPAAEVMRTSPRRYARARAVTGDARLRTLAADRGLLLDGCGRPLYAERRLSAGAQARLAAADRRAVPRSQRTAIARRPLADTFRLQSRPEARRTLYLDFTGLTVSDTVWNDSYNGGQPIKVPTFSSDGSSAFSNDELATIQRVWQIVAEDYAPFDLNVTTRWPGTAALDRSSDADQVYGARVVFAGGSNPVFESCRCGGLSYVDVFDAAGPDHERFQPAWVFVKGVGDSAKTLGEAAAHEAGHLFGLYHDGTPSEGYSVGARPWAPIMGASYYEPITQWSRGEYAGANQKQDDVEVIADGGAPLRRDDVGDTALDAGTLWPGARIDGVVSSRTDVDAFRFIASGPTTVSVMTAAYADLDARLRVATLDGTTVAVSNPSSGFVSPSTASGLDASVSFTAPTLGGAYVAYVTGVGDGDPSRPGGYSDYASLGHYEIGLSTGSLRIKPLRLLTGKAPVALAGERYSTRPVTARGGRGPYRFAGARLPAGLRISARTGAISGTPREAGTRRVVVTVTDRTGARARTSVALRVRPKEIPFAFTTPTLLPSLTSGKPGQVSVEVRGGTAPYTFRLGPGSPGGVGQRTSGSTFTMSGTPYGLGQLTMNVIATDATGAEIQRSFILPIVR